MTTDKYDRANALLDEIDKCLDLVTDAVSIARCERLLNRAALLQERVRKVLDEQKRD